MSAASPPDPNHTAGQPDATPSPATATRPPLDLPGVAKSLLEVGAVLAVVIYLILSIYYDRFYSRLGVEPAEVGLDRTAIVARAVGGVIAILLLIAAAAAIMALLSEAANAADVWIASRPRVKSLRNSQGKVFAVVRFIDRYMMRGMILMLEPPPVPWRSLRIRMVATFVTFMVLLALTFGWSQVSQAAAAAAAGRSVSPITLGPLRILDVKAQPCSIDWLGPATTRPPHAVESTQLRCLGMANGMALFRDGTSTIKISSNQIVVTLR